MSIARFVLLLALAINAPMWLLRAQASSDQQFVGTWEGTLEPGATKLRLGLVVERNSAGGLTSSLISIDQGNSKIPGVVAVTGDSIVVTIGRINMRYAAALDASRDTLSGTFTQGLAFPLRMHRVRALTGSLRPQEPKPPFPYATRDVSIESAPGVRLAGTVTVPAGTGPFPAVVFATGSGPQNRNEELMGHKPFLVIADYLARRGIASLRTDDRGVAQSTGNFAPATSADFANDAEAAVRFLRMQREVDAQRVGIIGHSEGGLIGPMVASRTSDVAFVVLLAGPGLAGDSILLLQTDLMSKASGASEADRARAARFNRIVYDIAKSADDSAAASQRLSTAVTQFAKELSSAGAPEAPTAAALMQQSAPTLGPWFRYFVRYDPRPALRKTRVPVLALNGTLDLQVPSRENLDAIRAALADGGNQDVEIVELPGLNHLFQTAQTGLVAEYATIEETMSPVVLERIATWITQRFGKR